jgi:hypothetical protein
MTQQPSSPSTAAQPTAPTPAPVPPTVPPAQPPAPNNRAGQSEEFQLEIYRQLCEDFRELDKVFWQIPVLALTLTGSLGFAVATFDMLPSLRSALLMFMGVTNLLALTTLARLRGSVMQRILVVKRQLEGTSPRGPSYIVVCCFGIVLTLTAVFSFYAAMNPREFFSSRSGSTVEERQTVQQNESAASQQKHEVPSPSVPQGSTPDDE